MRGKRKRFLYFILAVSVLILFFLLFRIYENEAPFIKVEEIPRYISKPKDITVICEDRKMGIRSIKAEILKGNERFLIFQKRFPYKGILNINGVHRIREKIRLDPKYLELPQGSLLLKISVCDYSRRRNVSTFTEEIILDTIPPSIRPISRLNYFTIGGSGVITYEVSPDTTESGIYLNNIFFPGYPVRCLKEGIFCVAYIAIPYDIKLPVDFYIWAKDKAGNESVSYFYYRIKKKRFRKDRIIVTERFLKKVLPFFSFYNLDPKKSDIENFLKINRELRRENNLFLRKLLKKTSKKRLWEGRWICLKRAKCTARFADYRSYFYKGKLIDKEVHLGLDLASVANTEVPASNNGRVIFAGVLGIYGFTVILDHGQGLFSLYGHLSKINVKVGQEVKKGQIIGITGQTGLAGGDHLHFSIIVNGIFVNPEEWLDYHWLKDNIIRKLKEVDEA